MTREQFAQVVQLARSGQPLADDDSALHGIALPNYRPATVTVCAAARFIRWHCINLDGSVNSQELNDMAKLFRHHVTLA